MATENNVMWFDKMNILQSEKGMRVRICNRLEKELIDIFDWVANFGSGFFYWELLDKKIYEARDMLIERYNWIIRQNPNSAKFMYENGVMLGYDGKTIESAMKHGT